MAMLVFVVRQFTNSAEKVLFKTTLPPPSARARRESRRRGSSGTQSTNDFSHFFSNLPLGQSGGSSPSLEDFEEGDDNEDQDDDDGGGGGDDDDEGDERTSFSTVRGGAVNLSNVKSRDQFQDIIEAWLSAEKETRRSQRPRPWYHNQIGSDY